MRKFGPVAVVTLALALTACGKKDDAPAAAASSDAAAAAATTAAAPVVTQAGEYAVFDAGGKQLLVSTINADGTYRDVPTKGLPVAGLWKDKDGKTCFDPSGKEPEACFTVTAPGADGSFTATGPDGAVLTVRPAKK